MKHFKGIKEISLPIGQLTVIKGDNATGKTTVYDALTYLLFGKDSCGRSEFEIQPLDEKGRVIHHLTTEVEGHFLWEGKALVLRKELSEKWQRPQGEETSIYKGTTTNYFINEILYQILNTRMSRQLVTLFTSNVHLSQLKHDLRITSRIEKMALPVQLPEESIRSKLAQKENEDLTWQLLHGTPS